MKTIYQSVKNRVFEIIDKAEDGDRISKIVDYSIMALIALSILSIVLESFSSLYSSYYSTFRLFEIITVIIFSVEYLLRIWTADLLYPESKHPYLKYIFSFMAIIDLLAILPFYLPFVSADFRFLRMMRLFRIMRLLRLFKLERYFDALQAIMKVIKNSIPQLVMAFAICFFVMLFSSIVMYTVEYPAQPEAYPNVIAALWWAMCTLTTVGYGDIYPITTIGKFLTSVISLVGIGIIAIPSGIIAAGFDQSVIQKHRSDLEEEMLIEESAIEKMNEEALVALQLKISNRLKEYGYTTTISVSNEEKSTRNHNR